MVHFMWLKKPGRESCKDSSTVNLGRLSFVKCCLSSAVSDIVSLNSSKELYMVDCIHPISDSNMSMDMEIECLLS